jgi:hypothetical protein
MRIWIVIVIAACLIGYAGFQAEAIILGPRLAVDSPASGLSTSTSLVAIRGTAGNISYLTLNGEKVFTDENGNWEEEVLLSYGYNVFTVEAKDRFGRSVAKTLQIIYK